MCGSVGGKKIAARVAGNPKQIRQLPTSFEPVRLMPLAFKVCTDEGTKLFSCIT